MTQPKSLARGGGKRRGSGEDAIYFDPAKNRHIGSVSVGFRGDGRRLRRKVIGKTEAEVRRRLKELHVRVP